MEIETRIHALEDATATLQGKVRACRARGDRLASGKVRP